MRRLYQSVLLVMITLMAGCEPVDKYARQRGTISGFAELVNAGVKQMALSGVMTRDEMDEFLPLARQEASKYNVEIYREPDLIITDLFPHDVAKDKEVLILFQGNTKDAYLKLKEDQKRYQGDGDYSVAERQDIARRFGRLLSYTPRNINRLLAENTDFRVMDDFGIQATNVFLYYKDLPAATKFYSEILGLELLTEYDNASILRIATNSFVILVDEAKGMHSAEEPKTVALALLTRQLPDWYDYLKSKNVPIRYTYKPKEGGPHDGFVAIDPEGYLLEFELFKQHKENERFVPVLATNDEVGTSVAFNNKQLGFHASITWLYYQDLLGMQNFYENVMGLELVADQGWTKIYKATDTGFIGLVDERRGMHDFTEEKAVNLSFIMDDLDGWFEYAKSNKPFELRSAEMGEGPEGKYRAFVGFDPEGYFMEFDKFYEHADNTSLMQYLSK
ncbi:MAG: VOC family protein [Roseivirga sp.]|nr:VOC family protein [Roseivirga sp.]